MYKLKQTEGQLNAAKGQFILVVGRFNSFVVESLVAGAIDTLQRHGIQPEQIEILRAPGAWELPLVVKKVLHTRNPVAIIVLGAVIRGGTPHFEYVAGECNSSLSRLMLEYSTPIANGVLTVESIEQAIERSGTKMGNKGIEAAAAALEMVNLMTALDS